MSRREVEEILAKPWQGLPRVSGDLPRMRGRIRVQPEDFEVEELPEVAPSGRGEHLFLWIEKRSVPAARLFARLAAALELDEREIGYAGLKDTHALTRQYVSVPARAEPLLERVEGDGVRLLRVERHDTKLKTGHLVGNRFRILVREVDAPQRAPAIAARLREVGVPNFFGRQRFGTGGRTLQMGRALLRGEPERGQAVLRRLALSSVQSALFNACLAERLWDGLLQTVLRGDVLLDTKLGTLSLAFQPEAEQARLAAGRVMLTGPMFGPKMREARHEAGAREERVLAAAGLRVADFFPHRNLLPGTRRPLVIRLAGLTVEEVAEGLRLAFELPAGGYATVLLRELLEEGEELDGEGGAAEEPSCATDPPASA